ncbi:hypothetical protein D3C73_879520 [compost metagenome]
MIIDDLNVHLKPSGDAVSNYTNRKKPTLWFFVGEPSLWNVSKNAISSKEIKITIPASSLDLTQLTYRVHDRVVGYSNEYIGPAQIEYLNPAESSIRLRIFKLINNPRFIYSAAAVIVGVPMIYIIYSSMVL